MHREEDGVIHFWRIREYRQNQLSHSLHWSESNWKVCLTGGGGEKRRFQYCTDDSGAVVCSRALQGHCGPNLVDPSLQDNVVNQDGFFKYIYQVEYAIIFHSSINSGLLVGDQNSSNRWTKFFLLLDVMIKNHKDPDTIDLKEPRLVQYIHKVWKKHQNTI